MTWKRYNSTCYNKIWLYVSRLSIYIHTYYFIIFFLIKLLITKKIINTIDIQIFILCGNWSYVYLMYFRQIFWNVTIVSYINWEIRSDFFGHYYFHYGLNFYENFKYDMFFDVCFWMYGRYSLVSLNQFRLAVYMLLHLHIDLAVHRPNFDLYMD